MGDTRKEPYSEKHSSAGRFWGFNRIIGSRDVKDDTVYMTRAWIGRLRFHLFHRGDQDPDCHDHPWDFWTFPLRSYVEEVLIERRETVAFDENAKPIYPEQAPRFDRVTRVVKAFRFHYRPATYKHRVIGPKFSKRKNWLLGDNLIPTFVWRGKLGRKWGFTKERDGRWCWVPWKTYIYHGGKDAPCSDGFPATLPTANYNGRNTDGSERKLGDAT